jgi:hypothetical protein
MPASIMPRRQNNAANSSDASTIAFFLQHNFFKVFWGPQQVVYMMSSNSVPPRVSASFRSIGQHQLGSRQYLQAFFQTRAINLGLTDIFSYSGRASSPSHVGSSAKVLYWTYNLKASFQSALIIPGSLPDPAPLL